MARRVQTNKRRVQTSEDEWETSAGRCKDESKDEWETSSDECRRMRDECYSIINESRVSYCFYFEKNIQIWDQALRGGPSAVF